MYVRMSIWRSLTKSQCSSLSTSTTPHGYSRPRTSRPSGVFTSWSEPTTANGILLAISSASAKASSSSFS